MPITVKGWAESRLRITAGRAEENKASLIPKKPSVFLAFELKCQSREQVDEGNADCSDHGLIV